MEKKEYLAPRVETVIYGADLMQHEVITTSPTPAGGVIKRQKKPTYSLMKMKIIQQKQAPFGMSRCGNKSLHC